MRQYACIHAFARDCSLWQAHALELSNVAKGRQHRQSGRLRCLAEHGVEEHGLSHIPARKHDLDLSPSLSTTFRINSSALPHSSISTLAGAVASCLEEDMMEREAHENRGNILMCRQTKKRMFYWPLKKGVPSSATNALQMHGELLLGSAAYFWTLHSSPCIVTKHQVHPQTACNAHYSWRRVCRRVIGKPP